MTLDYAAIRVVHASAAALSVSLFALRGAWMLRWPHRLQQRWVRIVPHVIDTVLLASALWLAWQVGAEGTRGWLWAKVIALAAYILLGTVALKRGRTRGIRIAALVAALATFGYIVSVAVTKSPLGVFARETPEAGPSGHRRAPSSPQFPIGQRKSSRATLPAITRRAVGLPIRRHRLVSYGPADRAAAFAAAAPNYRRREKRRLAVARKGGNSPDASCPQSLVTQRSAAVG